MRAWEFITEGQKRRPEISLRHLNRLKHINRARAASHAREATLKRIMYANPAREHERIELEKARLELEQQKAELAATRAEALAQSQETVTDMADAGSKANQQSRAKVIEIIVHDARAVIPQLALAEVKAPPRAPGRHARRRRFCRTAKHAETD